MEKLEDPRKLQYSFRPQPDSALDKFFSSDTVSPRNPRSQQPNGPSTSQPSSQNAPKSVEEFSERFKQVMDVFNERGSSDDFLKQVEEIIELSMAFHPETRAFVKALEVTLDEFVEEEEKGGLPKDSLKAVVEEAKYALDAGMKVLTDRKILQEMRATLGQPAMSHPKHAGRRAKETRARPDGDEEENSDEEDESDDNAAEQEDDEGPSASTTKESLTQSRKEAKILHQKRKTIMDSLDAEREANEKILKKMLDKIRDKRGYDWSIKKGRLVESAGGDLIIRGTATQQLIPDPITRGKITSPVRSTKCGGNHIYEKETLLQMVKQIMKKDQRGMKCAYLGCAQHILLKDIVEDEDYARFLARSVVGTSVQDNQ